MKEIKVRSYTYNDKLRSTKRTKKVEEEIEYLYCNVCGNTLVDDINFQSNKCAECGGVLFKGSFTIKTNTEVFQNRRS